MWTFLWLIVIRDVSWQAVWISEFLASNSKCQWIRKWCWLEMIKMKLFPKPKPRMRSGTVANIIERWKKYMKWVRCIFVNEGGSYSSILLLKVFSNWEMSSCDCLIAFACWRAWWKFIAVNMKRKMLRAITMPTGR